MSRKSKKNLYIIERRVRGTQTLFVNADTLSKAKQLADSFDPSVQGVDITIDWHGKASGKCVDKPNSE